MARIATGMSKKSNRMNAAALTLCYTWRDQFGIGTMMDAEFAWIVSGGKFGTEPQRGESGYIAANDLPLTIDTFKVAHYIIKTSGEVK